MISGTQEEFNGVLLLTVAERGQEHRSYIKKQYYKLPLQVLPPYDPDGDGTLCVYLLNPSGGILQNDRLLIDVEAEENSRICITTPSSTKLYKMKEGENARQHIHIRAAKGSIIEYVPDENVPYRDTDYIQTTEFDITEDTTLFAWDILSAGRIAREEIFSFRQYISKTCIYIDGKPVMIDSTRVRPGEMPVRSKIGMEDFTFTAVIYIYAKQADENLLQKLRERVPLYETHRIGYTRPDNKVLVIRLLAKQIWQLKEEMFDIWNLARNHILGKSAVQIRKY